MQNRCCKDCKERAVGCHSVCPESLEYKTRLEELRRKREIESQAQAAEYEIRAQFAKRRRNHRRPEA